MTQPTPYTRQYNFTDFQTTNPNAPLPGAQVDAELNAVKVTSDQTRVNLGVIQRDDTKLRNQSVHKDAFDLDALAMIGVDGFNPRGNWAATTVYAPQDLVNYNNATYLALIAHTATAVFPTDLAANKWILIANAAIGDVSSAVDYYTGNGSTTAFTLTYSYTSNTGVQVYVNGVLQLPIVGATPGDYSLSGSTLTFVTAPPAPSVAGRKNVVVWGANVTVQANVTAAQTAASNAQGYASAASSSASSAAASAATATTQATNASTSAASAAASATTATAQAVIATTQATTSTNQATTATSQATSATNSAAAAAASQSAAGTSATNAAASAATATTQATNAGNSATAASTSATNAAASASTATTQATSAANSATTATTQAAGATTSATNAATSATTATNQATIATTQATNASTSATNAAASATTATNQATTATTQATNAATSASGASTSATNAAASAATATTQATNSATSAAAASSSAVSAATSAASAAALLDNFDDRYLGPKASDPALDNDGNALITGALYFNTTDGVMKVYTASGWLAASSASVATLATFEFVATAAQTVFTGNDANGASLSYVAPALIVTLNGVRLRPGDDYTATNGTSITLVSAAAAGDELVVDAFGAFLIASVNGADIQNSTISANKLAAGVAVSNIGYTPVNKAGDIMTGALEVQSSWRLGTNTNGTGGSASPYSGGLGGGFNSNNNIYSMYVRDRTDTYWNELWLEAKTISLKSGNAGYNSLVADTAGRIAMPQQPAFNVCRTSSVTTNVWTYQVSNLNRGNHMNLSNGRFTAPIAGVYFFTYGTIGTDSHADQDIYLSINGTTNQSAGAARPDDSGAWASMSPGTGVINLNVGDYVQVFSTNTAAYSDGNCWLHFRGFFIG